MTDVIEFKLKTTNFLSRHLCAVCGGVTEKSNVVAVSEDDARICECCMAADDLDTRLEQHAAELDRRAAEVRARIGRVKAPSIRDFKALETRLDVATYAGYCMGSAHGDFSVEAESEYERVLTDDIVFADWRHRMLVEHAQELSVDEFERHIGGQA